MCVLLVALSLFPHFDNECNLWCDLLHDTHSSVVFWWPSRKPMKVHRVHKCFLEFGQRIEFTQSLCVVEQKHLHNFKNVEAMNCGWLEILKRDTSSLSHLVIQPGENSSWTHGQSWKYVALPFCRKQAFVQLFLSKATSFVLTNA